MKIQFHRIDKSLPLPEYHTAGAAAFDVYARTDMTVPPGEIILIPSNLVVAVPENHVLLLVARSSTAIKKGLILRNGVGIIDSDYRGPQDEIRIQVTNITDTPVTVTAGERIAQALIMPVVRAELEESDAFFTENRGGFGTTAGYATTSAQTQTPAQT